MASSQPNPMVPTAQENETNRASQSAIFPAQPANANPSVPTNAMSVTSSNLSVTGRPYQASGQTGAGYTTEMTSYVERTPQRHFPHQLPPHFNQQWQQQRVSSAANFGSYHVNSSHSLVPMENTNAHFGGNMQSNGIPLQYASSQFVGGQPAHSPAFYGNYQTGCHSVPVYTQSVNSPVVDPRFCGNLAVAPPSIDTEMQTPQFSERTPTHYRESTNSMQMVMSNRSEVRGPRGSDDNPLSVGDRKNRSEITNKRIMSCINCKIDRVKQRPQSADDYTNCPGGKDCWRCEDYRDGLRNNVTPNPWAPHSLCWHPDHKGKCHVIGGTQPSKVAPHFRTEHKAYLQKRLKRYVCNVHLCRNRPI